MPSNSRRAELVAEVSELHKRQMESITDATYIGWTPEELLAHQKRADRIEVLQRELGVLGRTA